MDKANNQNLILGSLMFLQCFNAVFHLEPQRQRTVQFLFGVCRSFYFHSLIKSTIFVSNGLLCLHKKQNNTCLRVDMKFLFSCSTRHLARSLCSLVSYRVKHSKRNSISTRTHVLIFIYRINRGAIQGFPALRKVVKTHVKKYRIFSRVLIQPISR